MTPRTSQPNCPANDDQAEAAGRRVPVIGQVGDGGVVTLFPGGREWLDAIQRRMGLRSTKGPLSPGQ